MSGADQALEEEGGGDEHDEDEEEQMMLRRFRWPNVCTLAVVE